MQPNIKPTTLPIKQVIEATAKNSETQPIDVFDSVLVSTDMKDISAIMITGMPRAYFIVFINPFFSTREKINSPIIMAIGLNFIASSIPYFLAFVDCLRTIYSQAPNTIGDYLFLYA